MEELRKEMESAIKRLQELIVDTADVERYRRMSGRLLVTVGTKHEAPPPPCVVHGAEDGAETALRQEADRLQSLIEDRVHAVTAALDGQTTQFRTPCCGYVVRLIRAGNLGDSVSCPECDADLLLQSVEY